MGIRGGVRPSVRRRRAARGSFWLIGRRPAARFLRPFRFFFFLEPSSRVLVSSPRDLLPEAAPLRGFSVSCGDSSSRFRLRALLPCYGMECNVRRTALDTCRTVIDGVIITLRRLLHVLF